MVQVKLSQFVELWVFKHQLDDPCLGVCVEEHILAGHICNGTHLLLLFERDVVCRIDSAVEGLVVKEHQFVAIRHKVVATIAVVQKGDFGVVVHVGLIECKQTSDVAEVRYVEKL